MAVTNNIPDPKTKLKSVDVAILIYDKFNFPMIPSGQGRLDSAGKLQYKSPWIEWKYLNRPGATIPTVAMIQDWDRIYHPTLWGFVTGLISGVTVYDTDDPASIKIFNDAGLTPTVITKRGQHFYFKYPGPQFDHIIKSVSGIIPHVDCRSAGGFINCIGSNSTASYKIVKSPADLYDIKQLPPVVIEGIGKAQANQGSTIRQPIGDSIPEGKRDQTIFQMACSLQHFGITQTAIEETMLNINRQLCKPPLPDSVVIEKVKSAGKYQPGNKETNDKDHWLKTSGKL